jgi:hypothetical protein
MNGFRIIEISTVLVLGYFIIFMTLPFEQHYDETLRLYAREPLFRILLGLSLVAVSNYSIPVAVLWFLLSFFLIADVQLVSTLK